MSFFHELFSMLFPSWAESRRLKRERAQARARLEERARRDHQTMLKTWMDELELPTEAQESFINAGLDPVYEVLVLSMIGMSRARVKTRPWWKDLGLEARPASREEARRAYSAAMLRTHPDHGGNVETMARVRKAWERAQKELEA